MKFKVTIIIIFLLSFIQNSNSENNLASVDNIFHIGKMDSHNKNFVLFFKTREKAILARGEEFNKIIPVTGLVMTKLDGTAKGGILIAIAKKYKLPIIALGLGEKEDDLQIFNAAKFANAFIQTN